MKNRNSLTLVIIVALFLSTAVAQKSTRHLLSAEELKSVVPVEFFFRGQKAPVQLRNSAGFQTEGGKILLAALVDASGYATAIQQKYQGILITETKLMIGDAELAPGEYGFGFSTNSFVVMNVANEDQLSVPFQTDAELKRPIPLKMLEDGSSYKLYAGKKWVQLKTE